MNIQSLLQNPDYKQKFVLEKLIQEYLGFNRETMRLRLEEEIPTNILQQIQQAYKSYTEDKKPLEYILGHVDFFGVPFYVNEHTLIPRPETEYMITAVTKHITPLLKGGSDEGAGGSKRHTLLDIGTGCGVLGISVLLQNPNFFSHAYFSDISPEALEVAKRNYDTLITTPLLKGGQGSSNNIHPQTNTQVHFIVSNLADFLSEKIFGNPSNLPKSSLILGNPNNLLKFSEKIFGNLILIANLPYIPDETFDNNALENVQKREPRLAFVGGNDGLDLYREMFTQIQKLHQNNLLKSSKIFCNHLVMFLEMMTRQVEILKAEFGDRLAFEEVKTFHFNIRIVKAWMK